MDSTFKFHSTVNDLHIMYTAQLTKQIRSFNSFSIQHGKIFTGVFFPLNSNIGNNSVRN